MAEAFTNVGLLKFLLGLPALEELGSVALLDLAKESLEIKRKALGRHQLLYRPQVLTSP